MAPRRATSSATSASQGLEAAAARLARLATNRRPARSCASRASPAAAAVCAWLTCVSPRRWLPAVPPPRPAPWIWCTGLGKANNLDLFPDGIITMSAGSTGRAALPPVSRWGEVFVGVCVTNSQFAAAHCGSRLSNVHAPLSSIRPAVMSILVNPHSRPCMSSASPKGTRVTLVRPITRSRTKMNVVHEMLPLCGPASL